MARRSALSYAAFGQIVYLLLVILFGAYVRATGSGAGCGSHWPLCNGQVIPSSPALQTIIEYSHRLSSSLTLPFALFVYWLARRQVPKGHRLRKGAMATALLVISEGLVGAGLVRFEHVADNPSVYRGLSMGLHLINTFALVAAAALTWYWSLRPQDEGVRKERLLRFSLASGLVALLILGISGAIAALGDTLFPVTRSGEAWQLSSSATQHLFVRLRVYHPFIAVFIGAYLIYLARTISRKYPEVRKHGLGLVGLVLCQLGLGYLNVHLLAPIWLQLIHLLTAELIWIFYVVFSAHALKGGTTSGRPAR